MVIANNEIKQTRGWVLEVPRWNGYFTLIFSDIKYKDFIDLIIDQDISFISWVCVKNGFVTLN